MSATLLTPSKK